MCCAIVGAGYSELECRLILMLDDCLCRVTELMVIAENSLFFLTYLVSLIFSAAGSVAICYLGEGFYSIV